MQKPMFQKDPSDPTELDILIAQIKAKDHRITDTFGVAHQVPFRIFQWNYERLEALRRHIGKPTRNKLLNNLLEVALEQVFSELEKTNPEQLKEILESIGKP